MMIDEIKQCENTTVHFGHYWREDGEEVRYTNDSGVLFCSGLWITQHDFTLCPTEADKMKWVD